ncbi:hypothetical protein [Rhizobium ruizarguesonis]|uniref:hypothetical protein n=1 Tax=Rhizobium ruizarguesonis TaxID=2081791 RepID=UPI00102FCE43|nr:hypothetical protein [Rhizobium ruizarguesonis]TAV30627.1 hypothetical protein ELI35_24840 [Rhizobium ruizarguesonis]
MQQHKLTPVQKAKRKAQEECRRRERRQREDLYRRRIERLRRQIEEARRRRQRLMLLLLLAILAMQESILATFRRSYIDWPDPNPKRDWTPDPRNDYAPAPDNDDYCDGYSYEQWTRMLNERGIKLSRKAELQGAWEADPEREFFPERYQLWGHKPYIGQLMYDLAAPYWRADAFAAIKLLTPVETHKYLDEAYATDPSDLRQCLSDRDSDIVQAFQTRAILWEERKRREAEETKRDKELSRKSDGDQGIPRPN